MRQFLHKRWLLLALVIGGTLSLVRPEWMAWTAWVEPRWAVIVGLFLIAMSIESRSLWRALRQPAPALWALVMSYLVLPVLAWGTKPALPSDLWTGLMIMACVPSTLGSALIWTRRAEGDEAIALLIIVLTCGSSWLITTTWLTYTLETVATIDPWAMMHGLILALIVPLGLGQLARAVPRLGDAVIRHKGPVGVVSQLLILIVILNALVNVSERLRYGAAEVKVVTFLITLILCLAVHLVTLATGLVSAAYLGFESRQRSAIAIAGSQKTLPVALFMLDTYFKSIPLGVIPIVIFHVGQLIVDTFIADYLAQRTPPAVVREEMAKDWI